MKKICSTILFLMFMAHLQAQTVQELTQQKQTQIKYLLEQIAAIQTHIGTVEKGYAVARKGLGTINDIKKGDFQLHSGYFASLSNMNPHLKKYSKIGDIITLQWSILQEYQKTRKSIHGSNGINTDEATYINRVFTNLIRESLALVDHLIALTRSGATQLRDDERLKGIDMIYGAMQDQYAFAQSFGSSVQLLVLQRTKEKRDAATLPFLYGLNR